MAEYLPFAGKNAIAEMSVGLQFQLPFDSKISESIEAVKKEFADDLPKFDAVQQFTLNVGSPFSLPAPPNAQGAVGFVLTKLKPDMSPARVLRAMGNTLSIHFTEYDSWQETKRLAIGYFDKCLRLMGAVEKNLVVAVFMRYVDRFTLDGELQEANGRLLFRENSKFLPSVIFDSGNLWHSNSGWYEALIGDVHALNNLGIVAVIQPSASITVDHTNVYSLPEACSSRDKLFAGSDVQHPLPEVLERQHLSNTIILKNLLNEKMLGTIGLKQ
jgi:uncharacterized protein (TIGR04255 family)